jgi:hypothetical protein
MVQFLLPVAALLAGSLLVIVSLVMPLSRRDRDASPAFVEDFAARMEPSGARHDRPPSDASAPADNALFGRKAP